MEILKRKSVFYCGFRRLEARIKFTLIPNKNGPDYNGFKIRREVDSKIISIILKEIRNFEKEIMSTINDNGKISIRILTDNKFVNQLYLKQNYGNFVYDSILEIIDLNLKRCTNSFIFDVFIQV